MLKYCMYMCTRQYSSQTARHVLRLPCVLLCPPVQAALLAINTALEEGDADTTLEALQNEHLDLSEVNPQNKEYYFKGLLQKKQEKAEVCTCMHGPLGLLHTFAVQLVSCRM